MTSAGIAGLTEKLLPEVLEKYSCTRPSGTPKNEAGREAPLPAFPDVPDESRHTYTVGER